MTALKTILTMILGLAIYAGATWLPVTLQIHDTMIEAARYLVALAWAQHINPLPFTAGGSGAAATPSIWSKIMAAIKAFLAAMKTPPPPAPGH